MHLKLVFFATKDTIERIIKEFKNFIKRFIFYIITAGTFPPLFLELHLALLVFIGRVSLTETIYWNISLKRRFRWFRCFLGWIESSSLIFELICGIYSSTYFYMYDFWDNTHITLLYSMHFQNVIYVTFCAFNISISKAQKRLGNNRTIRYLSLYILEFVFWN